MSKYVPRYLHFNHDYSCADWKIYCIYYIRTTNNSYVEAKRIVNYQTSQQCFHHSNMKHETSWVRTSPNLLLTDFLLVRENVTDSI